jgi:hypothetical protein
MPPVGESPQGVPLLTGGSVMTLTPEEAVEVQWTIDQLTEIGYQQYSEMVFQYIDLSENAKEVVRERYRISSYEDEDCSENITDMFYWRLKELNYVSQNYEGFGSAPDGLKVRYSLSNCQGDGVAFEGIPDDYKAIARRLLNRNDYRLLTYEHRGANSDINGALLDYVHIRVYDVNHHYTHYNSFSVGVEVQSYFDLTDRQEQVLNLLEENILEELVALSHELERKGYEEIDYRSSNDFIDEMMAEVYFETIYYRNGQEA